MRSMSIGLTVLLVLAALAVHGPGPRFATAQPPDAGAAPVSGVSRGGEPVAGEVTPSPRGTTVVFTLATVAPSPGVTAAAPTREPTATVELADPTTEPTSEPTAELTAEPASEGIVAYGAVVGGQWDIYTTDIDTGESTQLTTSPGDDVAPAWSPDGSQIAWIANQASSSQVWVMNRDGSDQRQVTTWTGPGAVYYATWLPDGSELIVTVADNAAGVAQLISQPIDGGEPSEYTEPWSGVATFAEGGAMAYTVRIDGQTDIFVDDGGPQAVTSSTDVSEDIPSINRDGTAIVYQVGVPGGRYLEIHDLTTGSTRQLAPIGDDSNPVWSPDGERIAFVSEDGAQAEIYVVGADGSGAEILPTIEHETLWYLSWSA